MIGLVSENNLPKAYTAKTEEDGETVTIKTEGKKPLSISKASFASVCNVLSRFAPEGKPTLGNGVTITLSDEFSGEKITVVASSLVDIATAIRVFGVEGGDYIPAQPPIESSKRPAIQTRKTKAKAKPAASAKKRGRKSAAEKAAETTSAAPTAAVESINVSPTTAAKPKTRGRKKKPEEPAAATMSKASTIQTETAASKNVGRPKGKKSAAAATPPVEAVAQVKTSASRKKAEDTRSAAPVHATTLTASEPKVPVARDGGRLPKALVPNHSNPADKVKVANGPDFLAKFHMSYILENTNFRFDFTPLQTNGKSKRAIVGVPTSENGPIVYGYEVKNKDEHIGWLIIEGADHLVMTGVPGQHLSNHKDISGAINRMNFGVIPQMEAIRKAA